MNSKITTKINVKDNLIGVMRVNNKDYISHLLIWKDIKISRIQEML